MEDSEVIIVGIPNLGTNYPRADLIITDKRLIFFNQSPIKESTVQQFGGIDGLFNAIREKRRNNYGITDALDEIIKSDFLNRSYYYEDIKEAKIKRSKHWWWKINVIAVKGIAVMGNKKELKMLAQYVIDDNKCEQLSDELIKVDGLKGKLTIQ